jgi:hypothetical protein
MIFSLQLLAELRIIPVTYYGLGIIAALDLHATVPSSMFLCRRRR